MDLFDLIERPLPKKAAAWVEPSLPDLSRFNDIYVNFETDGLDWWDDAQPVGLGIGTPNGDYRYIPIRHRGDVNLDESTVYRWAQREWRGKRITNINTRFEVHMSRVWGDRMGSGGLNLEDMGCEVSDVAHYAALLDDFRLKFNLDTLLTDFCGGIRVPRVDERRMIEYHPSEVAERGAYQVEAVHKLRDIFWPMLDEQGLQKVRTLEDKVIFVVCEMEKNGTKINVDLLDQWVVRAEREVQNIFMDLYRETGYRINPDSNKDMEKLFKHLGLPIARTEPSAKHPEGQPSFTAAILKKHRDNPTVAKIIRASKLMDLLSKYLHPYAQRVDRSTGILRYALHQLRAQKDPFSEDSRGTVSGRFSSTQLIEGVGVNIQQIMKTAKQRVAFGFDEDDDSHDDEIYPIRQLHIPEHGQFLSADAMQIEYRMFAHYTNSPRLIDIYKENPMASFHKETHKMLKEFKPDLTYRRQKDFNFANIYGAGLRKQSLMLDFIDEAEFRMLNEMRDWYQHPLMAPIKDIRRIYNNLIPEVKPLLETAQHVAMPYCFERCKNGLGKDPIDSLHRRFRNQDNFGHRGFVMTILGRRSRFPTGQRVHKALNSIIQGGAADINKQKLVELHAERKKTGFILRYTVHDEVDGDATTPETAKKVEEILNRQSFPELKVPILWEVGTGRNWKECA